MEAAHKQVHLTVTFGCCPAGELQLGHGAQLLTLVLHGTSRIIQFKSLSTHQLSGLSKNGNIHQTTVYLLFEQRLVGMSLVLQVLC